MGTPHLNPDKYRFVRALRPFSFSVALITCGLGVALAFARDHGDIFRAWLVICAGVLLQAASNLANDHADLALWRNKTGPLAEEAVGKIRFNFRIAALFTSLASLMGLYLVMQVGWELMVFGLCGVLAGYFYTGEPIQYKHKGFGVPAVFLLTGVLMVSGAYYAVSGEWSNQVVEISLPVSLITAALLLSNELRDYLDDRSLHIRTLTVRLGFNASKGLYVTCLLLTYPLSFYLFIHGQIENPLFLLPSLIFVWQPVRLLMCEAGDVQLVKLPPLTGRFFMIFGAGFILSVI